MRTVLYGAVELSRQVTEEMIPDIREVMENFPEKIEWCDIGNSIILAIESEKPNDAMLRIRKQLGSRLGPKYKMGVRKLLPHRCCIYIPGNWMWRTETQEKDPEVIRGVTWEYQGKNEDDVETALIIRIYPMDEQMIKNHVPNRILSHVQRETIEIDEMYKRI